jgi:hypothetical protein
MFAAVLVAGLSLAYQRVKSILQNGFDSQPLSTPARSPPSPEHENLHGLAVQSFCSQNSVDKRTFQMHD